MEQFQFPFQQLQKSHLPQSIQELITAAELATEKAHAPYSNFKVGAALLMDDGSVITGANQENASYPAGICAERAALATLNMNDKRHKVTAIAISYRGRTEGTQPLSPCGICRQYMLEVQLEQQSAISVYMCSPEGRVVMITDASYLLPFYFSNADLQPKGQ